MGAIRAGRQGQLGVVVMVCALLSACDAVNGGGDSADDLLKPSTQASAASAPGGLAEMVVAGREADGFAVLTSDQAAVEVAQDACAAAAYALSGTVIGEPKGPVVRQASGEKAVVTVVLAEYEGERAQLVMDVLATAVDACADGFTAKVDGEERGFGKVALELAPEAADQAIGLGAVVERADGKLPVKAVVLRKGNTVAYLSAVPKGRAPKDFAVPAALVDAQLAKLS